MCVIDLKTRKVISDCGKCSCGSSASGHDWITSIPQSQAEYCSECFTPKD